MLFDHIGIGDLVRIAHLPTETEWTGRVEFIDTDIIRIEAVMPAENDYGLEPYSHRKITAFKKEDITFVSKVEVVVPEMEVNS